MLNTPGQHNQEPQLGALQQESRFDTAASLLLQSVDILGREIQLQGDSSEVTSYLQVETTNTPDTAGRKDRIKTTYSIDQNGKEVIAALCDALDVSQIQSRQEYEYLTILLRDLSNRLKLNLLDADPYTQRIQKQWIKRATEGVRLRALNVLKKAENVKLDKSPQHLQAEAIKADILRTSMLTLDGSEESWRIYSAELSFYYARVKVDNDPALNAESRKIISIARNFGFQEHCAAMQKKIDSEPQKPLIGSVLRNHTKLRDIALGAGLAVAGGLMISEATKDIVDAQEVESMYTEDTRNVQATLEAISIEESMEAMQIPYMMSAEQLRNAPKIDYRTPDEVNISLDGKLLTRQTADGRQEDGVMYLTSDDLDMPKVLPSGQSLRISTRENIPITMHHSTLYRISEIFNRLIEIVREDKNGDGLPDNDPMRLVKHFLTLKKGTVEENYIIASAEIVDAWTEDNGQRRPINTSEILSIDSIATLRKQNIPGLEVEATCYSFKKVDGVWITDKYLILGIVRVDKPDFSQPLRPQIQMARQEIQSDKQEGKLSKFRRLIMPINDARQWVAVRAQKLSKQTVN